MRNNKSSPHRGYRSLRVALVLLGLVAGSAWAGSITLPRIKVPDKVRPVLTTFGDPANNVVAPPSLFDGVGLLLIDTPEGLFGCSGSLLLGGQDVLTAAHCLTDIYGNLEVNSLTATFFTAAGPRTFNGANYYVDPDWAGGNWGDVGVVRLASETGMPGYDIFRPGDLYGDWVATLAGYGESGTGGMSAYGVIGEDPVNYPFGTLRWGLNQYDALWTDDWGAFAWAYDFDDGTPAHDALCLLNVWCDQGTGGWEVMLGAGDSGGPSFIGGKIAGIHSFGATFGPDYGDIDWVGDWPLEPNASFGELGGDTIVELYSGWIDQTVAIPEPGSVLLVGLGLLGMLARVRRRGQQAR